MKSSTDKHMSSNSFKKNFVRLRKIKLKKVSKRRIGDELN